MKRNRNGKIVATMGPASSDYEHIEKLFLAGVDVFRLNFSHGEYDWHKKTYEIIRMVGKNNDAFPTIMADMQGPKLRVGTFENNRIILESGDTFRFDLDKTPGDTRRVCLPHPEIFAALKAGATLLLDDGKLRFEVTSCGLDYADVKVLVGGPLSNRKGVNVPDVLLPIPALTEKDRRDLNFALDLGVDWVALSFVQSEKDVIEAKGIIDGRAKVVSKIEKPMAVKSLEPIIEASDGIMVARGDLGVEMAPEEVPCIQRRIVSTCLSKGRPVIVATQMLESMITCPTPTRAEVSDVATAVFLGADATMLSAESASGQYPIEAVSMMNRVITNVESNRNFIMNLEEGVNTPHQTKTDAICCAARDAADYSCAKAIVLVTDSFDIVVRCSRLRPKTPILLATAVRALAQKAGMCRGVTASIINKKAFTPEEILSTARSVAAECKFAAEGDTIVILSDISDELIQICSL